MPEFLSLTPKPKAKPAQPNYGYNSQALAAGRECIAHRPRRLRRAILAIRHNLSPTKPSRRREPGRSR